MEIDLLPALVAMFGALFIIFAYFIGKEVGKFEKEREWALQESTYEQQLDEDDLW